MADKQPLNELRITLKCIQPNPLFQEWLEKLHQDAKKSNSKIEPMLKEALCSLSKYPLPLKTGAECAILKGFNSKLCQYLDQLLERHDCYKEYHSGQPPNNTCEPNEVVISNGDTKIVSSALVQRAVATSSIVDNLENQNKESNLVFQIDSTTSFQTDTTVASHLKSSSGTKITSQTEKVTSSQTSSVESYQSLSPPSKKKKSKERIYRPAFRSGAYAILVALLEHMQECPDEPSLTKENIIVRAQKHSEESFLKPRPESFYTAWSNVSRLVTKGLVEKTKRKKVFYALTEVGIALATELLKESKNTPTANDIIFNNVVSGTASTSYSQSSTKTIDVDTDSNSSQLTGSQLSNTNITAIDMMAGSFDVILLIDKNETGGVSKKNDPTVAQFNTYPDLKHEYRSLKVGDFTWVARHKVNKDQELVLPYVVERKRMDDLGSSIKDGRFHEQKFRLRKCGLKNVIYMIENYGSNKHVGLPIQSLMQALANTRVQDGFKVHITDSLNNSARFLAMMTKRLHIEFKDKDLKGYNRDPVLDDLMTFSYFNQSSIKSKPLTVTETFIKLLLQLKGVSVEKALAITKKYSTPAALLKVYDDCGQRDGEMLLVNLKYDETSRNVGPKISKAIYQLFTQSQLS